MASACLVGWHLVVLLLLHRSSAFLNEELVANDERPFANSAGRYFGWTRTCCADETTAEGLVVGGSAAAMLGCTDQGISLQGDGEFTCISRKGLTAGSILASAVFSIPVSSFDGAEGYGLRVEFESASEQNRGDTATYSVECGGGGGVLRAAVLDGTDSELPQPPYNWTVTSSGDLAEGCAPGTNVIVTLLFELDTNSDAVGFDSVKLYRETTPTPSVAPTTAIPTTSPTTTPTTANPTTASPTPMPYNPPDLNSTTEVVIEGLGIEAFPDDLEGSFIAQFVIFTLLYGLLVARVGWEFAVERCRSTSANRHTVMICVILGCVVRLCYVDLVDIVPSTPLELEFALRGAKELLWFAAFAFLVHYWVEVQCTMRVKLRNVEGERGKLLCSVVVFASLRVAQIVAECLRADATVIAAKAVCGVFLVSWVCYAALWTNRLRIHVAQSAAKNASKGAQRLTRFLLIEIVLFVVLVVESSVALWAQEKGRITLRSDSNLVFAVKVSIRATEWLLLAVLVSTVTVVRRRRKENGQEGAGAEGESSTMAGSSRSGFMMRAFRPMKEEPPGWEGSSMANFSPGEFSIGGHAAPNNTMESVANMRVGCDKNSASASYNE